MAKVVYESTTRDGAPLAETFDVPDDVIAEARADGHTHTCVKRRERRKCPGCGFARPVLIRYWLLVEGADVSLYARPWERYCGACDKEQAARAHEHLAAQLRAKAAQLRAGRRERMARRG